MKPPRRQRLRNEERAHRENPEVQMLRRVVQDGSARRAAEHQLRRTEQRMQELELQRQRQRDAEQTFVQNALVSAFVSQTGTEKRLVRPDAVSLRTGPSGKLILKAVIEVEITLERWGEHFSPLLVPFSGPITYNAYPSPKPPPKLCGAASPAHFGRMNCSLLEGHKLPHEHAGQHWTTSVKR